jgi:hypothetical protein
MFKIAETFWGCSSILSGVMVWPRYSTHWMAKEHYFGLIEKLALERQDRTLSTSWRCCSKEPLVKIARSSMKHSNQDVAQKNPW